jgi:hypothetical protein
VLRGQTNKVACNGAIGSRGITSGFVGAWRDYFRLATILRIGRRTNLWILGRRHQTTEMYVRFLELRLNLTSRANSNRYGRD